MRKLKLLGRVVKQLFIVILKAVDCAVHYLLVKIGIKDR